MPPLEHHTDAQRKVIHGASMIKLTASQKCMCCLQLQGAFEPVKVDESSLTGESMPVTKSQDSKVQSAPCSTLCPQMFTFGCQSSLQHEHGAHQGRLGSRRAEPQLPAQHGCGALTAAMHGAHLVLQCIQLLCIFASRCIRSEDQASGRTRAVRLGWKHKMPLGDPGSQQRSIQQQRTGRMTVPRCQCWQAQGAPAREAD